MKGCEEKNRHVVAEMLNMQTELTHTELTHTDFYYMSMERKALQKVFLYKSKEILILLNSRKLRGE